MTRLLVDNSVLQRVGRAPTVASALHSAVDAGADLCSNVLSTLEAGFSARSADEHTQIVRRLTRSFTPLVIGAQAQQLATDLQSQLWAAGRGRAVGVVDLLLAATAFEHDAVVLHYDTDFDLLAQLDTRVLARWVVPRGSVD